ncbi:hypothetical protein KXW38_009406, partial [Aspergillus fumigatus]
ARHPCRSDPGGEGHLYPVPEFRPAWPEARRFQADRLHARHAGALPASGPGVADRRPHGQAGKPLLAHRLSQADLAHRRRQERPALRLHVRQCERRRRHHGGGDRPPVPPARQRPADDGDATRGLPGGSRRLRGVGGVPHGVRLRPVERRRLAAAVHLRGGAPLRIRRPQRRFRPDPQGDFAHRQGRPQIWRLSRAGHAASGRTRCHHHFPVQHAVFDAPGQRPRPGAAAFRGVRRGCEPAVLCA